MAPLDGEGEEPACGWLELLFDGGEDPAGEGEDPEGDGLLLLLLLSCCAAGELEAAGDRLDAEELPAGVDAGDGNDELAPAVLFPELAPSVCRSYHGLRGEARQPK